MGRDERRGAAYAFQGGNLGVRLVGVEDRTAHVRGVENPLDLDETLANLINVCCAQKPV